MVDRSSLEQMLSNLARFIRVLKTLGETAESDFLLSPDKIGNAKYHFVVAIEYCIDIANHIIASEGFRFPTDNADSFSGLVEEGLVPRELGDSLRSMARFRNRLVHLYGDVDDRRVYGYLHDSLPDMEGFAAAIAGRAW